MLVNNKWDLKIPPNRAHHDKNWDKWEVERLEAMYWTIEKGDIVFEIGAEEGDCAALFQKWGAEVVIFEPNINYWKNIKDIFELNNLKPLKCFVGFVSNETNGEMLDDYPVSEGQTERSFRHLYAHTDIIPQIKIDDVGIIPNVMSIDVEGSELEVLKGAKNTLLRNRVFVFVSIHDHIMKAFYNSSIEDIHKFMKSIGYKGTHIAKDHEDHWMFEHDDYTIFIEGKVKVKKIDDTVTKYSPLFDGDWRKKMETIIKDKELKKHLVYKESLDLGQYSEYFIDGIDLWGDKPFTKNNYHKRNCLKLNDKQRESCKHLLKCIIENGLENGFIFEDVTRLNIILKGDHAYLIDYEVIGDIDRVFEIPEKIKRWQEVIDFLGIDFRFRGNLKELLYGL